MMSGAALIPRHNPVGTHCVPPKGNGADEGFIDGKARVSARNDDSHLRIHAYGKKTAIGASI